jgi:hypothetical protein
MSTANFTTMDNFDLWVYEPDFCGETSEPLDECEKDFSYWCFKESFNALPKPKTEFFDISLKSGHYDGVQIYVDYKPDLCDPKYMDNDATRYFLDMPLSVAKRKHEAEIRRIQKWLARLGRIGAVKLIAVARFSNGEVWYERAKGN